MEDFFAHADLLLKERMPAAAAHKPAVPRVPAPVTAPAAVTASPATTH